MGKRQWIIDKRKGRGLIQEKVSNAIGVSRSHYSMFENGHFMLQTRAFIKLMVLLEFNLSEISSHLENETGKENVNV